MGSNLRKELYECFEMWNVDVHEDSRSMTIRMLEDLAKVLEVKLS